MSPCLNWWLVIMLTTQPLTPQTPRQTQGVPDTQIPARPLRLPPQVLLDTRVPYTTRQGLTYFGTPEQVRKWKEEDEKSAALQKTFQQSQQGRRQQVQAAAEGRATTLRILAGIAVIVGVVSGLAAKDGATGVLRLLLGIFAAIGLAILASALAAPPPPPPDVLPFQR